MDRADHAFEFGAFGRQLPASGRRQRVIAGAAIVFGRAPFGLDPTANQEALQRRMALPMDTISPQIRDVLRQWIGFKEAARVLIYAPFRNEVDLLSMTADYPKKQ